MFLLERVAAAMTQRWLPDGFNVELLSRSTVDDRNFSLLKTIFGSICNFDIVHEKQLENTVMSHHTASIRSYLAQWSDVSTKIMSSMVSFLNIPSCNSFSLNCCARLGPSLAWVGYSLWTVPRTLLFGDAGSGRDLYLRYLACMHFPKSSHSFLTIDGVCSADVMRKRWRTLIDRGFPSSWCTI